MPRCTLCYLPTFDATRDLCPQCLLDRGDTPSPWPPPVDPAGPASAAARAIAEINLLSGDCEDVHQGADRALKTFLYEAGFADVAAAYLAAEKRVSRGGEWWYA